MTHRSTKSMPSTSADNLPVTMLIQRICIGNNDERRLNREARSMAKISPVLHESNIMEEPSGTGSCRRVLRNRPVHDKQACNGQT